jgi:hypothetical protein
MKPELERKFWDALEVWQDERRRDTRGTGGDSQDAGKAIESLIAAIEADAREEFATWVEQNIPGISIEWSGNVLAQWRDR